MKTVAGLLCLLVGIFLLVCVLFGIHVSFNAAVVGLGLSFLGIGGSLISKIWLPDPPDKTMVRIAKALESIAEKIK
jgi:uncharacterized membrane protein